MDEYFEHYRIQVDKGQEPIRIDKFLTGRLPAVSRNRIQNAIAAECIRVNGIPVKANYKIRAQEIITLVLPQPPRDTTIIAENIPLDIVFEDEYLLVVNKPAGMVVHPAHGNFTGTLVNALVWHFDNLPTANGKRRPGLVHRIDKDTSGLLVVAKDEYSMTHLAKQFFEHSIERAYMALAWGRFKEQSGTIRSQLARSPKDRRITQVYHDSEIGKHAITHYAVLEEFSYATLLECRLETGRTHQIRAHLQYMGHPLFSDAPYGGSKIVAGPPFTKYRQFAENCFSLCPRQALHARLLSFTHPHTGERLSFDMPPPSDMTALIEKWRRYEG